MIKHHRIPLLFDQAYPQKSYFNDVFTFNRNRNHIEFIILDS